MHIYIVGSEGEDFFHEPFTNKRDAIAMCRESSEDGESAGDFDWMRVDACEHIKELHNERLELRSAVTSLVYAIGEAHGYDTVERAEIVAALDKARELIEFGPNQDYAHDELCKAVGIRTYEQRKENP